MEWQIVVALVVAIPIILFPVVFVWYLNIGGLYTVIRETQKRHVARNRRIRELQVAAEAVIQEVR